MNRRSRRAIERTPRAILHGTNLEIVREILSHDNDALDALWGEQDHNATRPSPQEWNALRLSLGLEPHEIGAK